MKGLLFCAYFFFTVFEIFESWITNQTVLQYKNTNLDMLRNFFYPVLQTKKFIGAIVFEKGGALVHFAKTIHLCVFGQAQWSMNWKKRTYFMRSTAAWFIAFRLFYEGYVRTNINKTRIKDLNDLKTQITQEI